MRRNIAQLCRAPESCSCVGACRRAARGKSPTSRRSHCAPTRTWMLRRRRRWQTSRCRTRCQTRRATYSSPSLACPPCGRRCAALRAAAHLRRARIARRYGQLPCSAQATRARHGKVLPTAGRASTEYAAVADRSAAVSMAIEAAAPPAAQHWPHGCSGCRRPHGGRGVCQSPPLCGYENGVR